MMLRLFLSLVLAFPAVVAEAASLTVDDAVAGSWRTPGYVARDPYRHPAEALKFFGVTPYMTVVEVWPSTGWWTEILAPYLKDRGSYVAAGFVTDAPGTPQYRKDITYDFLQKMNANPALYGDVYFTPLGLPDQFEIVPAGTADLVLSFRNVHNWIAADYAPQMFASFFAALKDGGILGIVEHRASPGTDMETMKTSGYITEAEVVRLATEAGFQLLETSELNANPKDTHDHPKGVWTLPPSLRLGEQDKDKYLAIGESDRMTIKFIKPTAKP